MLCIAERAFSILRCRLLALHRRESVLHPLLRDDTHGHLVRVRARVGVGVGARVGARVEARVEATVRVKARARARGWAS